MKTPAECLKISQDNLQKTFRCSISFFAIQTAGQKKDAPYHAYRLINLMHDNVYEHINVTEKNRSIGHSKGRSLDFVDDVFNALTYAGKTREAASAYIDSYFSDKDNDDPKLMASVIFDCSSSS
jgi:hypothetical protein